MAQLSDQIERAGDKNGVTRSGLGQRLVERLFGGRNDGEAGGVVRSDFSETRRGDGAGGARLGKNNFGRVRKELAGDFVNGFVAKRPIDQPDFPAGKVLFEELREFARGARIVRAIQINVRAGLQFFEAARPNRFGNSFGDVAGRNAKTMSCQLARRSKGIDGVLQLEAAGQAGSNFERVAGSKFVDKRAEEAILRGFLDNPISLGGFDHRTAKLLGASEDDFGRFRVLFRKDYGHSWLEDSRFFSRNFFQGVAEEIFMVEINARDDRDNGRRMFVASSRPPKPTSKTPNSTRSLAKYSNAMAVTHSK